MSDMSVTVTVGGVSYSVVTNGSVLTIYRRGVYAGSGVWRESRITDAPAVLPENVFDALDAALFAASAQLAERARLRAEAGPDPDAAHDDY